MTSRKCICPWPECREWAAHLESVPAHSHLSKFVCFRYKSVTELQKALSQEEDPEKKVKVKSGIKAQLKFRNLVLHHLKAPYAKGLAIKDLYVRRFHFPHEYIKTARYIIKPVTRDIAVYYGVGVLPRDSRNVACKENEKYFIPPIITRSHMKILINGLVNSENDEISTRASRRANRRHSNTIVEEISTDNPDVSNPDVLESLDTMDNIVDVVENNIKSGTHRANRQQSNTIVEEISADNPDISNPDVLESLDTIGNIGDVVENNINSGTKEVALLDYIYISIRGMAGLSMGKCSKGLDHTADRSDIHDYNASNPGVQSVTPDAKSFRIAARDSEVTVFDYVHSVDHLTDKLEQIVRPILAETDFEKIRRKGEYFNSIMMQNEHCVNITLLLSKCHKCTEAIPIQTTPPLALMVCASKACNNAFFSFRKRCKQRCHQCNAENKIIKRKRKRKEGCNVDGTMIDSKVNITKLSPTSRAKRMKRASYVRNKLKEELENALKAAEKVELCSEREGDAKIISLIEKTGHLPQEHIAKY